MIYTYDEADIVFINTHEHNTHNNKEKTTYLLTIKRFFSMKKSFYMACAAAIMLASCSQNELGGDTVANENEDLVPIKIGVSQKNMSSRGTGTVGGLVDAGGNAVDEEGVPTDPSKNVWKGESFNLFMFEAGTLELAKATYYDALGAEILSGAIFDNEEFKAPNGHDGTDASDPNNFYAKSAAGNIRYYPAQGAYDFWAYRLDDCVNNTPGGYAISDDQKQAYIDFVMDGTQDIMTAHAVPSVSQIAAVGGEEFKNRFFSAWTARKGQNPNLKFQHELTRLKFFIKAGNAAAADPSSGIRVEKIQVKSLNTGRLIVAYTPDQTVENNIVWKNDGLAADSANFVLMERTGEANNPLTALTPQDATSAYASIGEALLVAPQDKYELVVTLSQQLNFTEGVTAESRTFTDIKTVIKPQTSNTISTFAKGSSYKVKLTLYGLQQILVQTELTPWTDGEEIEFTPEEDDFKVEAE